DDGPAKGSPELIAFYLVLGRGSGKEILRIEKRIADVFKDVAVKGIGTRFSHHVDYAAGILAVLRAVVSGLNAEFLKSIRKGEGLVDVGVFVHVVAAIELVADRVLAGAVYGVGHGTGERLGCPLVGATVGGIHGARD